MKETSNLKILLLGDSGSGKTSFLNKYINNEFKEESELTIGVDYSSRIINNTKIEIWDTAGQEVFRSITTSYFRGSNGVLIFMDLTNIDSINNIEYWINTYIYKSGNNKKSILLLGNKSDSTRAITFDDAIEISKFFNVSYLEISVKYDSIEELEKVLNNLIDRVQSKSTQTIKIPLREKKKAMLFCNI